jgi:hypothetical protein
VSTPVSSGPQVRAQPPQDPTVKVGPFDSSFEAGKVEKLAAKLGLTEAIKDGAIDRSEAEAAKIDFTRLAAIAGSRSRGSIDGYLQLLEASPRLPEVSVLTRNTLFGGGQSGDYLVFAPVESHAALMPLLNHRALLGHQVRLVDPREVYAHYQESSPEALARFVREARQRWDEPKPAFLLLVGDSDATTPTVPTFVEPKERHGNWAQTDFPTDNRFGDPDENGVPRVAIGRLPSRDAHDLSAIVQKTIRYEAVIPPGLWQARATLVEGKPGWGDFVDRLVNWYAESEQDIAPPQLELRRISFNEESGLVTGDGLKRSLSELKEGGLYYSFVGHGAAHATDAFSVLDVPFTAGMGNQVVSLTACSTGSFNDPKMHSLTEALVKTGPAVAAIGASQLSTPHNNAAWARALGEEMVREQLPTTGQIFQRAKQRVAENDLGGLSGAVQATGDALLEFANWFGLGPGSTREAHMYLYNLMGDPAVRLRRPLELKSVTAAADTVGKNVSFSVSLPDGMKRGTAYVSFERPPGEAVDDLEDPSADGISAEEKKARLERNANKYQQRSVASVQLEVLDGTVRGKLPLPDGLKGGNYSLRVAVVGEDKVAVGAATDVHVLGAWEEPEINHT